MNALFRSPLVRLDNNLWRYIPAAPPAGIVPTVDQIQIQTPLWDQPALSYRLGRVVQKALKRQHISQMDQLKAGFYVNIRDQASGIAGKWKVSLTQHNSLADKFWQFFPVFARYPNRRIAHLIVSPCSKIEQLFSTQRLNCYCMEKTVKMPDLSVPFLNDALTGRFSDAFTDLARVYHQTVDPYFVFEEQVLAAFRYVLDINGQLSLKKITGAPNEFEENRRASSAFRDYIVNQYGRQKLDYVNAAYGFSLDDVVDQGLPLVPDHVFKTNIGMCNIEMNDLQQLYEKIAALKNSKVGFQQLAVFPQSVRQSLVKIFQKEESFAAFIANLPQVSSVRKLPVAQFNQLVNAIMPTSEERERAFTGRKIRHLAIGGWNTMGNHNIFTPSRDLFEFMHVYDEMEKTNDWENYHELATHVACKKNLFLKTPPNQVVPGGQDWHVGLLIPAPRGAVGEARWYYNAAFVDDGLGNVNYVILPACENYQENGKPLPFIKNYRSTVFNRGSIDWLESFEADLNPYGYPGSIHPNVSFQQEKGYFDKRTIPLWVAHLLRAGKSKEALHAQEAIDEYVKCLKSPGHTPPQKLEMALQAQVSKDPRTILEFLHAEATLHQELPEFKIAEDVASIGHSLGGSLAEFAIYYFGPRRRRIPLPDRNFICYASRGPAIDTFQDKVFMTFGRKYAQLLVALGQRWKVRLQMEYGDIIPESGQSHLGTTGYDKDQDACWLEHNITLFRPLETAQALGITTMSTHCRRTGVALAGRDFTQQALDVKELSNYDHDWWMSQHLIDLFGYRILRSSKVTEIVREFASIISRPFWVATMKIYNFVCPPIIPATKNGVIFLRYPQ